ncbi:MAG: hypothetical protein CVU97_05605 [Firmicutes bacterium HGW-Firmicutes-21]|nr:MAG: hypothetical protein CVU97_05605 [Firmicutes bacterium HGW-Firmicutes-21]
MAVRTVFLSPEDCKIKLDEYFERYLPDKGEIADIESLADFLGATREELIAYMSDEKYGGLQETESPK